MKKILAFAALIISASISFNAFAGGSVEAGKAATAKYGCAACHGADFNTPIDPSYPKLAGQHPDYIEHALTAYQRGGDGPNGRANAIMGGQAKPLSDQDKKDIGAYLHSLPGTLVLRK
jgi:cytochrome c553